MGRRNNAPAGLNHGGRGPQKEDIMKIRDKNSMKKVYAVRCYKVGNSCQDIPDDSLLMQIPRCYTLQSPWGPCCTSGFKSLLRIKGRWTLDNPYYCYGGGPHRHRRVPRMLSLKLDMIATRGDIGDKYQQTKNTIAGYAWKAGRTLNIIRHIRDYQQCRKNRHLDPLFDDILEGD